MYFFVKIKKYILPSLVGIEPTTFGLEVQRAILCATGTTYHMFDITQHIYTNITKVKSFNLTRVPEIK